MTVWENVGFSLKQHTKLSDQEIRKIATEKLALVGLKDVEDKMPSELSGGMKKRVGLARAIAMDAAIILYDEPTTGLDPITADAINDLIVDLRKKLGVTSVAITHDMHSAYKISDRIAMLYKGEILEIGHARPDQEHDEPHRAPVHYGQRGGADHGGVIQCGMRNAECGMRIEKIHVGYLAVCL